jgi:serine/threonine protein kinase
VIIQNILVLHPTPNWWVKISDFGISKKVEGTALRTAIGTESYLAPEVRGFIADDDNADGTFSLAVDVWAVGAIVFRMIAGQLPF